MIKLNVMKISTGSTSYAPVQNFGKRMLTRDLFYRSYPASYIGTLLCIFRGIEPLCLVNLIFVRITTTYINNNKL